jgi:hypothetical protein
MDTDETESAPPVALLSEKAAAEDVELLGRIPRLIIPPE